jgi:hypothetical protein
MPMDWGLARDYAARDALRTLVPGVGPAEADATSSASTFSSDAVSERGDSMSVPYTRLVVLAVVMGTTAATASARLLENWPYERLLMEADLVIIAQATAVEDTAYRMTENPWKAEFLGVCTTFQVKATLKGTPTGKQIKVLHFKLKDGVQIINGPMLVSFRTKGFDLELKDGPKVHFLTPEYMLFLKAQQDGRYEPLSGRVDPELSIRELYGSVSRVLPESPNR